MEGENEEVENYDSYCVPDEDLDLAATGNGSSDILKANCAEFDRYQWEQVIHDKSSKEIARAMADQGSKRFDASISSSDGSVNQKELFEMGNMYVHQRAAIIERLERGFDAKRDRDPKLAEVFPAYVAPPVLEIKIQVTCQIKTAKPQTKKVSLKREEGLAVAITKCKQAHKGISLSDNYTLVNASGETVTDDNIKLINEGEEFNLVKVAAALPDPKAKTSKSSKAAPPAQPKASAPVSASVINVMQQNSIKIVVEDVERMIIPISQNVKFHESMSLLSYMVYWAAYCINGLNGKMKDSKRSVLEINVKDAIDALMSLQRALKEMRSICPEALVADATNLSNLLHQKLVSMKIDILTRVADDYSELIDKATYDFLKPTVNRLYEEQGQVLDILYEKMKKNERCLIGYRVPPSGGKTILSVAIASMISKYFRVATAKRPKRLLYVCYNTLVRLSVANACEQAAIPFWVASTRAVAHRRNLGRSVIATSYSCRDRSKHALRERRAKAQQSNGGDHKFGEIIDMWNFAEEETKSFNPIVISDITSASELLDLFPDDFIVYLDEPTAGAENGIVGNSMQKLVCKIIQKLPKQAVLLSATLPNIKTELPALLNKYREDELITIETQRLPVGCVAVTPTGKQLLPHEIAQSWEEFKDVVTGLKGDALMQRFYTPGPVHSMALCIEKAAQSSLPVALKFNSVISNIGDISHKAIRSYAQSLLAWVIEQDDDLGTTIFEALKKMHSTRDLKPVLSENFVVDHVASEGRALAVTTSNKISNESDETLEELISKALSPYAASIPDIKTHLQQFMTKKAEYQHQYDAFLKAKNPEAADTLAPPEFEWPIKIAGFSATLSDEEMNTLDGTTASNLLSGLGRYDPSKMTLYEQSIVIREAVHGHLACLFSSPDIVYGTNMALISVFIGSGYGRIATRNSLYQLIGRAGRTGKSHKAKILFQDHDTMKKALIPEKEAMSFEARVMDWHLKSEQQELGIRVQA